MNAGNAAASFEDNPGRFIRFCYMEMVARVDQDGKKQLLEVLTNQPFQDAATRQKRLHPSVLADIPRPDWWTGKAD